jgi:hypothetical protein
VGIETPMWGNPAIKPLAIQEIARFLNESLPIPPELQPGNSQRGKGEPNKSLRSTPASFTPAAGALVAPPAGTADR